MNWIPLIQVAGVTFVPNRDSDKCTSGVLKWQYWLSPLEGDFMTESGHTLPEATETLESVSSTRASTHFLLGGLLRVPSMQDLCGGLGIDLSQLYLLISHCSIRGGEKPCHAISSLNYPALWFYYTAIWRWVWTDMMI